MQLTYYCVEQPLLPFFAVDLLACSDGKIFFCELHLNYFSIIFSTFSDNFCGR